MKKSAIIILSLICVSVCSSQTLESSVSDSSKCNEYISETDSIAYVNRRRADKVLSCFSEYHGMKMLYTRYVCIQDKLPNEANKKDYTRYYVVLLEVDTEERYKDFLVSMNMDEEIVEIKERKVYSMLQSLSKNKHLNRKKRKFRKRLEALRNAILEDGFNINNYKKGFVTDYVDVLEGKFYICPSNRSYFVLKDGDNNRYGEYFCYNTIVPYHINIWLRTYLLDYPFFLNN